MKNNIKYMRAGWISIAVLLFAGSIVILNIPENRLVELSWIPGISMLISGCINIIIYQKNKRYIHGADWLLAEGMSTALLSLFPLFNEVIYPVVIPFFFGVWELISGLLRAIDTKGMFDEKTEGRHAFAVISALELLSGTASMVKPVDDLLGMNIIISAIMFVQCVGFVIKAVYTKQLIVKK